MQCKERLPFLMFYCCFFRHVISCTSRACFPYYCIMYVIRMWNNKSKEDHFYLYLELAPTPSHCQLSKTKKMAISPIPSISFSLSTLCPRSRRWLEEAIPNSVADPGCLSPILILSIPDLRSKNSNKREGWKKWLSYLFCSRKYHKIENWVLNWWRKKKISANLQRII